MLIECLNDSKKSLETSEKTQKATAKVNDKSGETQANDGSITFKLFSDLSETELNKLTKVRFTSKTQIFPRNYNFQLCKKRVLNAMFFLFAHILFSI
jgi:hypothetical protein